MLGTGNMPDCNQIKLGVVGTGRIAQKFMSEIPAVSGLEVVAACNPNELSVRLFCEAHGIEKAFVDFRDMLATVDAVYIASPHATHFEYGMCALLAGKHVLCEKPIALSVEEVRLLYAQARESGVAFLDGVKTAYYPAFSALEGFLDSGHIGEVVDVEASFTKLLPPGLPELSSDGSGGSILWLASYPLYAIGRLMGTAPSSVSFYPLCNEDGVDTFARVVLGYPLGSASLKVGFGAKTDGSMVVTGTEGFLIVPAPWWNTKRFEVRREDPTVVEEYEFELDGYGMRYEIAEFVRMIRARKSTSDRLTEEDSLFAAYVLATFKGSDR